MRRVFLTLAGCLLWVSAQSTSHAQQFIIKFATIAPENSTWMKVMREYDATIRKESDGRMGFKIYAGGVQGEDKDVIPKIRLGQLHSAGLTGFGLGKIAPKLRILDSPFLFESYDEVDHLYNQLDAELSKSMLDNGFVNLGWTEVGFVYVYTNTPVKSPADMNGVKMWMWEGDPIAEATFKAFDIQPITLSVIDACVALAPTLHQLNGEPIIRPLMMGGEKKYVMFLHDYQARGMRTSTTTGQWLDIQKAATSGGERY
ncbi:MAG: TRAP transporter substrate-binding protein DctP, partial [Bacteroidota bacterium]